MASAPAHVLTALVSLTLLGLLPSLTTRRILTRGATARRVSFTAGCLRILRAGDTGVSLSALVGIAIVFAVILTQFAAIPGDDPLQLFLLASAGVLGGVALTALQSSPVRIRGLVPLGALLVAVGLTWSALSGSWLVAVVPFGIGAGLMAAALRGVLREPRSRGSGHERHDCCRAGRRTWDRRRSRPWRTRFRFEYPGRCRGVGFARFCVDLDSSGDRVDGGTSLLARIPRALLRARS